MDLSYEQKLVNNVYTVIIGIDALDEDYIEAVNDYGEQYINLGGKIMSEDEPATLIVELPNLSIKLTDLLNKPISQQFSKSQYADKSLDIATKWGNHGVKIIKEYKDLMVSSIDSFSKKETISI